MQCNIFHTILTLSPKRHYRLFQRLVVVRYCLQWCFAMVCIILPLSEILAQTRMPPEALLLTEALMLTEQDLERDANLLGITGVRGATLYTAPWRYSPADSPDFSSPTLNDSAWKRLPYSMFCADTMSWKVWKGAAWFRLRIKVSKDLHRRPLVLATPSVGAMDVYCDGVLLGTLGRVGTSAENEILPNYARSSIRIFPLLPDSAREYTIAVRYSCFNHNSYRRAFLGWQPAPMLGMNMVVMEESSWQLYRSRVQSVLVEFGAYCIAPLLAFVVHLLFFLLYRSERSNLALAVCNLMLAIAAFLGLLLLHDVGQTIKTIFFANILVRSAISFAFLAFAYSLYYLFFEPPFPRTRYAIIALTVVGQIFAFRPLFVEPNSRFANAQGVLVLPLLYSLYLAVRIMMKKPKGAYTLGVGIIITLIAVAVETTLELRGVVFAARPPLVGLMIRMSIFLSLPIALMLSMGQRIAAQTQELTDQNELLEKQVEERTAELQAANEEVHRQLTILEEQSRNIELASAELQERNKVLDQLNTEKAELIGIVAHDLKNPISGVLGLTEVLLEEIPKEGLAAQIIEQISSTTARMLQLVKNLLNVQQFETGGMRLQMTECDMMPLLESILSAHRHHAEGKNIAINVLPTSTSTVVLGDEQALLQVFDNLISNAVKYSPQGKNVFIRLSRHSQDSNNTEATHKTNDQGLMTNDHATKHQATNHRLRIEIQDEGEGITAEDMKKIFGKYARLSARPTAGEDSTGLGLSIVKSLVTAMNGDVWCESQPQQGATFLVELPLAE